MDQSPALQLYTGFLFSPLERLKQRLFCKINAYGHVFSSTDVTNCIHKIAKMSKLKSEGKIPFQSGTGESIDKKVTYSICNNEQSS